MNKYLYFLCLTLIIFTSCVNNKPKEVTKNVTSFDFFDLDEIQRSGQIIVLSTYSPETYYENHGYGSCGLQPDFIEGTSFSAPIVTGIAAQILENNPAFSIDPTFVKAALLLGADLSAMNTMGDSQTTQHVYNKNGAGMVNAINSIDPRIHIEYYGAITQSVIPMNTYDYYFYAGDREQILDQVDQPLRIVVDIGKGLLQRISVELPIMGQQIAGISGN